MFRILILTIFIFFIYSSQAQEIALNKSAEKSYTDFSYAEATKKYIQLYGIDSLNPLYISKIADSYLKINESENAEIWLEKLISVAPNYKIDYIYKYAQALAKNKKYIRSKEQYEIYQSKGGLKNINRKLDGLNNLDHFFLEMDMYTVEKLAFNTLESDFGPFYLNKGIGFVSNRKAIQWVKNTYTWDQSNYLDFYYYDPLDTTLTLKKLDGLNSKYHEGPAQVYNDGTKIVFTRNSAVGRKLKKDENGVTRLQILFAEIDSLGNWSNVKPFIHNTVEHSFGHPTITNDGQIMIYTSDLSGGFGGTDLYYSLRDSVGVWSQPTNLGRNVNTTGDEMFPFLSNGLLYFSSNGLDGLGGLDIYTIEMNNQRTVGESRNAGAPLNSSKDDFGLIADSNNRHGYFASDREGNDDIYEFKAEFVLVEGRVLSKGSNAPISGAIVTLSSNSGQVIGNFRSDSSGYYKAELSKGITFSISADKADFQLDQLVNEHTNDVSDFKKLKDVYLFQRILVVDAMDASNKEILSDVEQTVRRLEAKELVHSINDQEYKYAIEPMQYEIISMKAGYYTKRDTVDIGEEFFGLKNYTAEMKQIIIGESIRLDHIYYDVNSAHLRPDSELELNKVVVFMNDNPHVKIELSSHTDSRGSAPYNQKLSQRRAESASDYLVQRGIDKRRIVPKGYGEDKIVNRCVDNVKCTNDEHQENRRTEIKILENY